MLLISAFACVVLGEMYLKSVQSFILLDYKCLHLVLKGFLGDGMWLQMNVAISTADGTKMHYNPRHIYTLSSATNFCCDLLALLTPKWSKMFYHYFNSTI